MRVIIETMRNGTLRRWLWTLGAAAVPMFGAENPRPVVEVGPAIFQPSVALKAAPRRSDLAVAAARLPESARHDLGGLTAAERTELQAPDRRGGARPKRPAVKVGVSRDLPAPIGFNGLPSTLAAGGSVPVSGGLLERSAEGSLVWTASFSSAGAGALRLYIRQARLPAGSRVYVYGEDGEVQGPYNFSPGIRPEGFWTNTIFSDRIFLEAQLPARATPSEIGKAMLLVGAVVHLEHPDFAPPAAQKGSAVRPKSDACFIDRSCVTTAEFPNVDQATKAVGQLTFVDGGSSYVCTGGLMNTTTGSSVPYLLTANHCFSSQASATSLEAFWQYRTATCNGPYPDESLFPRTLGSTLLATGASPSSDFTFVQLSQDPPSDSVLLGWTTADVSQSDGLMLYRLSYANGNPMIYTQEQIDASPANLCSDSPRSAFLYSKDVAGGTGGGSSGSPLYLEDLRIVGQEYGECGSNQNDDCDVVNNDTVDGQFRVTYPSIAQWLSPGNPAACVTNATTLCLNGGRFRVTVYYATPDGASGPGMGVGLTGDSGYFWFFDAANIELVVKVLDACTLGNFWVFAGGLTNVGVTLIVEDTQTGATKTYNNAIGTPFAPLQDTRAFSCP